MMTGIVLAGGKAKRMGGRCDKAFLKICDESIIMRQLSALKKIFKSIIIVTNTPKRYRSLEGITLVSDIISGRGPLGGIYSGLLASNSFYNFVVACDMPFLNTSFIKFFINNKKAYDIIVPKIDGRVHPLFGVYSKNCVPIAEKMLRGNRLNVSSMFREARVRYVSRREAEKIDKGLLSLANVNTRDELVMVRSLVKKDKKTKGV